MSIIQFLLRKCICIPHFLHNKLSIVWSCLFSMKLGSFGAIFVGESDNILISWLYVSHSPINLIGLIFFLNKINPPQTCVKFTNF